MPTRFDAAFSEALLRGTLVQATRAFWRPKIVQPPGHEAHFPPEAPCFVYGNHSNQYDPFFLNGYLPWGGTTRGVMTLERLRGGFVTYLMRSIGMVPTRKAVPEPRVVRELLGMVKDGHRVTIYPEHGCRWAGRPQPWIETTAKLFHRASVPVYPVITRGSYVCWPRWATYPRPGRIEIVVLPPFRFERSQPFEEVFAALKAAIDFDENVAPERLRPKRAYRPADGLHKLLYRDPETGAWDAIHTPDGTQVRSHDGDLRWTMLPDSRLRCERTGDVLLTGDLLERVRALPLEPRPDGTITEATVHLHEETGDLGWHDLGPAKATLTPSHIALRGDRHAEAIPLDAIRYTGIERTHKLQLTLASESNNAGRVLQLTVGTGGSALGWDDTIHRLRRRDHDEARIAADPPHSATA